MNADHAISSEGNDPKGAADRLGDLIDTVIKACPDAVVLVAIITGTCDSAQAPRTREFQGLIPGVVKNHSDAGAHIKAVDFSTFKLDDIRDCIHPTNKGYKIMGDYWYDFMQQIPGEWINEPVGMDPVGHGVSRGYPRSKRLSRKLLFMQLFLAVYGLVFV